MQQEGNSYLYGSAKWSAMFQPIDFNNSFEHKITASVYILECKNAGIEFFDLHWYVGKGIECRKTYQWKFIIS